MASPRERLAKRRATSSPAAKPGETVEPSIKVEAPRFPESHPTAEANAAHRARRAAALRGEKRPSPTAMRRPEGEGNTLDNPHVVEAFLGLLENQLFRHNAAAICKLPIRTIENWMRLGRVRLDEIAQWHERSSAMREQGETEFAILENLGPLPEYDRYADFHDRVLHAEGISERTLIGRIVAGASEDPKCAQWLLERKHPRRYGRAVVSGKFLETQDGVSSNDSDPVADLVAILGGMRERLLSDGEDDDESEGAS